MQQLQTRSEPGLRLRTSASSVLAVPVIEERAGATEEHALALYIPGAELAAVGVMDEVGRDQRREHEDADRRRSCC